MLVLLSIVVIAVMLIRDNRDDYDADNGVIGLEMILVSATTMMMTMMTERETENAAYRKGR